MPEPEGPKRAQEATLSARPSDPRLREAQRLHHEKRQLQRQADEVTRQHGQAASEAEAAKLAAESERLRNLAQEREAAAEALEQQRAAEPVRQDVPEIEIFEPDRLRTALREGHRVVLGEDGHIRVWEERGRPMTDEQIDYLESKLPELRHRLGEGWNFTIETDGTIGGNGPWGAHYYASSTGQLNEEALAQVRAFVGQGQDVSIAPDGTVVTSEPVTPVSAEQARRNLETFNREVESGALTERMDAGQGYDLNPDGTGGYSAIAPMTAPTSPDTAEPGVPPAPQPASDADPTPAPEPTSEQNSPEAPGSEPTMPSEPTDGGGRPAPTSDQVKALEDRARALREDLAEARDRRIDIGDRVYATHRAAELAARGAASDEAEAKTLRTAAKDLLDEAARFDKQADEAEAAGRAPEAEELRERAVAAMAAAKGNTEIASRRTESAERFRAEVAKNEAENQALVKQRNELSTTLKKSEAAIDSLETKASLLRQSDTIRTAAEGLEHSAMAQRASGNEPGAAGMEASARDMRAQADVLRVSADAVQVDEATLKELEDLAEPTVDQSDPMPPEEPAAGPTETSAAPEVEQSGQDTTGEGEAEAMAESDLDGMDGRGVSADSDLGVDTATTEDAELFGQEGQTAEADPEPGSYQDPYEDPAFTTPEPVPTYAEAQTTESYESYDEGSDDGTA